MQASSLGILTLRCTCVLLLALGIKQKEYNSNVESSVLTFDQYALPIGSDDMDPASDPIRVSVRCPSLRAGWDQCNTPIGSASSMDAGCVGIAEVFTPLPSHLN